MLQVSYLTNQCTKIAKTIAKHIPNGQTISYLSKSRISLPGELASQLPHFQGQNAGDVFILTGVNNAKISVLEKFFKQLKQRKSETEILYYLGTNPSIKKMYETYSKNGIAALADDIILQSDAAIESLGIKKTIEEQSAFSKWLAKFIISKTSLTEQLAKNYEKIASARPEMKAKTIYLDFAQRARKGEFKGEELYRKLLDSQYNLLRIAEYDTRTVFSNIEAITEKATPRIRVKPENGWHYRGLQGQHFPKAEWRISINANGNPNLISKLDNFITPDCYYKTPDQISGWLTRHDPITIYFKEKPTQTQIDNLIDILKQTNGIRSSNDVLPGIKIIPGVAMQTSPSHEDVIMVLEKAVKISPDLKKAIESFLTTRTGEIKASAGQLQVINNLFRILS